jgi:hypothetical protein
MQSVALHSTAPVQSIDNYTSLLHAPASRRRPLFESFAFSTLRQLLPVLFNHRRRADRASLRTLPTPPNTSTYSAPVVVTAYSGPRVLAMARGASSANTAPMPALPPVSAFTFSHVLLAIDEQIEPAISGLSTLCAKSRLSLASEHESHLPPQGEILGGSRPPSMMSGGPVLPPGAYGYGRTRSLWVRTTGLIGSGLGNSDGLERGTTLSVVLEAENSSGSRSSVSGSGPSEAGTLRSALGSLREVLSKGGGSGSQSKGKGRALEDEDEPEQVEEKRGWAVKRRRLSNEEEEEAGAIVVVGSPSSKATVKTTIESRTENSSQIVGQMGGSGWWGWSRGIRKGKQPSVESTLRGILDSTASLGESEPAMPP